MPEVRNSQLNIFINTGDAQRALDVLKKKEAELKASLAGATDPRVVAKLSAELKKLEVPIDNATKKLKGQLSPSVIDLSRTVVQLQRDLKNLSREDPAFNKKVAQFRTAKLELEAAKKQSIEFNNSLNQGAKGSGFLGKLSSGAAGIATGFGIGAGITLATQFVDKTIGFFGDSINESLEAVRQLNNFKQALEAAGRIDAFDRLKNSADELAKSFKFLDNDEILGSFSQLITYGKLTEDEINKLIPLIIDFYGKQQLAGNATFTLAEATSVVIKGLEGNAKALKEYGINVKDGGNETERLNILLTELGARVKGAGAAFGEDFTGQVQSAQQEIKNLQEEIGNELLPIWEKTKLAFLEGIKGLIEGFKMVRENVSELFMSDEEVYNKEQRRLTDADRKRMVDFANSFSLDASKKTIEEQKKILEGQRLILKNQQEQLEKQQLIDTAIGAGFTKQAISLNREVEQSRLIVDKLEQQINISGDKKTFGGKKTPNNNNSNNTADELKRLKDELKELERQFNLKGLSDFQRKIEEINNRFDKIVTRAKELNQNKLIDRANTQREKELQQALEDFEQDQAKKLSKGINVPVIVNPVIPDAAANSFSRQVEELIKGETPGSLLGSAADSDSNKKEKLTVHDYLDYANEIVSIYGSLSSSVNDLQQQELDAERIKNEKKKESFQKLLDSNLISRKEYDRRVSIADQELAKKEKDLRRKQFNRDKIESSLRAAINIAEAITKALSKGPLVGQILAGVAAAFGAIQLGFIASKKFPDYGRGGKLSGPLHSQGGMPVINPRTGNKEAEVEGGEVILSRNTVKNNAHLINELLYSSLNRNGEAIGSVYRTGRPLPQINFAQASQSLQRVTRYERGGNFTGSVSSSDNSIDNTLQNLTIVVNQLQQRLGEGIVAVASLQQFNNQQQRLANLKADVTMK